MSLEQEQMHLAKEIDPKRREQIAREIYNRRLAEYYFGTMQMIAAAPKEVREQVNRVDEESRKLQETHYLVRTTYGGIYWFPKPKARLSR